LVFQTSCCKKTVNEFRDALRCAAAHYEYDLGKLKSLLQDEWTLGQLRLDAARSLDSLAVHQFSKGTFDTSVLQYNKQIFKFQNINTFISALQKQWTSGITLALIQDTNVFKTYFALGLRSGDTIVVLTDYEEGAHPDYHRMTRRPERQLERRAKLHWFPYYL